MESLEQIRKNKLEELQQRTAEEQQAQQELAQLESMVKQRMTKDAVERLGNIKLADPEKAVHLMVMLAQLIQKRQIQTIDDASLKQVLQQLTPKKREFKITRR